MHGLYNFMQRSCVRQTTVPHIYYILSAIYVYSILLKGLYIVLLSQIPTHVFHINHLTSSVYSDEGHSIVVKTSVINDG